ncbi:hypothetical protein PCE1_001942 [Barthelona sp. PCE]
MSEFEELLEQDNTPITNTETRFSMVYYIFLHFIRVVMALLPSGAIFVIGKYPYNVNQHYWTGFIMLFSFFPPFLLTLFHKDKTTYGNVRRKLAIFILVLLVLVQGAAYYQYNKKEALGSFQVIDFNIFLIINGYFICLLLIYIIFLSFIKKKICPVKFFDEEHVKKTINEDVEEDKSGKSLRFAFSDAPILTIFVFCALIFWIGEWYYRYAIYATAAAFFFALFHIKESENLDENQYNEFYSVGRSLDFPTKLAFLSLLIAALLSTIKTNFSGIISDEVDMLRIGRGVGVWIGVCYLLSSYTKRRRTNWVRVVLKYSVGKLSRTLYSIVFFTFFIFNSYILMYPLFILGIFLTIIKDKVHLKITKLLLGVMIFAAAFINTSKSIDSKYSEPAISLLENDKLLITLISFICIVFSFFLLCERKQLQKSTSTEPTKINSLILYLVRNNLAMTFGSFHFIVMVVVYVFSMLQMTFITYFYLIVLVIFCIKPSLAREHFGVFLLIFSVSVCAMFPFMSYTRFDRLEKFCQMEDDFCGNIGLYVEYKSDDIPLVKPIFWIVINMGMCIYGVIQRESNGWAKVLGNMEFDIMKHPTFITFMTHFMKIIERLKGIGHRLFETLFMSSLMISGFGFPTSLINGVYLLLLVLNLPYYRAMMRKETTKQKNGLKVFTWIFAFIVPIARFLVQIPLIGYTLIDWSRKFEAINLRDIGLIVYDSNDRIIGLLPTLVTFLLSSYRFRFKHVDENSLLSVEADHESLEISVDESEQEENEEKWYDAVLSFWNVCWDMIKKGSMFVWKMIVVVLGPSLYIAVAYFLSKDLVWWGKSSYLDLTAMTILCLFQLSSDPIKRRKFSYLVFLLLVVQILCDYVFQMRFLELDQFIWLSDILKYGVGCRLIDRSWENSYFYVFSSTIRYRGWLVIISLAGYLLSFERFNTVLVINMKAVASWKDNIKHIFSLLMPCYGSDIVVCASLLLAFYNRSLLGIVIVLVVSPYILFGDRKKLTRNWRKMCSLLCVILIFEMAIVTISIEKWFFNSAIGGFLIKYFNLDSAVTRDYVFDFAMFTIFCWVLNSLSFKKVLMSNTDGNTKIENIDDTQHKKLTNHGCSEAFLRVYGIDSDDSIVAYEYDSDIIPEFFTYREIPMKNKKSVRIITGFLINSILVCVFVLGTFRHSFIALVYVCLSLVCFLQNQTQKIWKWLRISNFAAIFLIYFRQYLSFDNAWLDIIGMRKMSIYDLSTITDGYTGVFLDVLMFALLTIQHRVVVSQHMAATQEFHENEMTLARERGNKYISGLLHDHQLRQNNEVLRNNAQKERLDRVALQMEKLQTKLSIKEEHHSETESEHEENVEHVSTEVVKAFDPLSPFNLDVNDDDEEMSFKERILSFITIRLLKIIHVTEGETLKEAFYRTLFQMTDVFCYIVIGFFLFFRGSLMNAIIPFFTFMYAVFQRPKVSPKFWKFVMITLFVYIVAHYIIQFPFICVCRIHHSQGIGLEYRMGLDTCTTCIQSTAGVSLIHQFPYMLGLTKFNDAFWKLVWPEMATLFMVIFHRTIALRYGVWDTTDSAHYFEHSIDVEEIEKTADDEETNPNTFIIWCKKLWVNIKTMFTYKPSCFQGVDLYIPMFIIDFLTLLVLPFAVTSKKSLEGVSSSFLPGTFVVSLLVFFLMIMVDRVLYFRQSNKWKRQYLTGSVLLGILLCVVLGPRAANILPNESLSLRFVLLLRCIHALISGFQLKYGFPSYTKGNFVMRNNDGVHNILHTAFTSVPFVYELRVILDWTFSDTVLDFFEELKFQDIFHTIFKRECAVEKLKQNPEIKNEKQKILTKILFGGTLLLLVILLLFGPLFAFSSINPTSRLNPITGLSMSISINNYYPIYANSRAAEVTPVTFEELQAQVRKNSFLAAAEPRDVFKIKMFKDSEKVWAITPPNREALVESLNNSKIDGDNVVWVTYTFEREFPDDHKSVVTSVPQPLNVQQSKRFAECIEIGRSVETIDFNLVPKYFYLPLSGDVKNSAPYKHYVQFEHHVSMGGEYFSFMDTMTDDGVDIYVWSMESSQGLDKYLSNGLIGFYTGLVLVVWRAIHGFVVNKHPKIPYEDLQNPTNILSLCNDLLLVRDSVVGPNCAFESEEDKLKAERRIYELLLNIYRSQSALVAFGS